MKRLVAVAAGVALAVSTVGSTRLAGAEPGRPPEATPPAAAAVTPSAIDSYIVVLKDRPLVDTIGRDEVGTPAAAAPAAAVEASHDEVLADAGLPVAAKVQDYVNGVNGFAAHVSFEQAQALAADPKVAAVLPDELHAVDGADHGGGGGGGGGGTPGGPSTGVSGADDLGSFLGLSRRGEAWKAGLTGEGVTIGVIDSGIWPEHPSFADDGMPSRQPPLSPDYGPTCQFGTSTVEPAKSLDSSFECNNKLIGAREVLTTYKARTGLDPDEFDSARDDQGHGTHTASTAAGNAGVQSQIFGVDYGVVSGIAPRAHIIAYKAVGRLGAYSSDLVQAIDEAIADHVDVINYSVGGTANLLAADATALLFATKAGIAVATSASNGGPDAGTIGGPADVPWVTAVGATTQRRVFRGTVTLDLGRFGWGPRRRGLSVVGASVTPGTDGPAGLVDGAAAGNELCLPGALDPTVVAGNVVLCLVGGDSPVDKSLAVRQAGGVGVIVANDTDDGDLYSDNAFLPMVMLDHTPAQLLKTYVRLARDPKVTLSTGGTWTWPSAPSMASFSSRGPNDAAPDVLKPDLVAPGMQILAGDSPVADPSVSAPGQLFQAISGTSMAGPIVAGMFALLKQEHPDWSPARLRSALMTTADTDVVDNDRRTPAGPFAMGAGMVDPGVVDAAGSAFNPGIVYDAGAVDYLGFLCGEAPQWFASFDVGVTCDELAAGGVSTTATDLNTPSIAVAALPGTTTVTRTITSVASKTMTWWAAVKAPPGYRVTVSPSRLTLAPGASASFTVTFTNTGRGKVGAWSTGAMTWKSGWFTARSALAVRGSALDVPADVDGRGTSGSLTFGVKFGYTGTYTATAHGLVAPTPLDGTVEQDPDAKFPSADDDQGGVAELPVTLAGVDHARWTLRFAPGDPDDLDMYLYDSAGRRVAVSGNVGTDEQIDLDQPADGDYTLVVHGFKVTEPGGRAFTVQQWLVPLAPSDGSNFEIADAPASASVATAGDVVVAWHDLQAGTGYLGTVTHADATGVLQTTLVDIAA